MGRRRLACGAGVIGASSFRRFHDTPAIRYAAVERSQERATELEHYVVPLTVFILVVLFSGRAAVQRESHRLLGRVLIVWCLDRWGALWGLVNIRDDSTVLGDIPGTAFTL